MGTVTSSIWQGEGGVMPEHNLGQPHPIPCHPIPPHLHRDTHTTEQA